MLLLRFLIFLFFSLAAFAAEAVLLADHGWIRAAPPAARVMAGYLTIRNKGTQDVVVERVSSVDFGAIEIHKMALQDGVMRMRRVPSLRIPAGGVVELKPGGMHLMLFRPQRPLPAGSEVELVLGTSGGDIPVTLAVREAAS